MGVGTPIDFLAGGVSRFEVILTITRAVGTVNYMVRLGPALYIMTLIEEFSSFRFKEESKKK